MVEILTAVAITTLIVFALVSMFNTSTKALLMGIKQKDVWESARASFGMLSADIEKVTEGGFANTPAGQVPRVGLMAVGPVGSVLQLDNGLRLTNVLQDLYMVSRDGDRWDLSIYRILRNSPAQGVGTLYRFQTNYAAFDVVDGDNLPIDLSPLISDSNPFRWPDNIFMEQASRMVDGIVRLNLISSDNDGRPLYTTNSPPAAAFEDAIYAIGDPSSGQHRFQFSGDTLPAAVDLEFFVLEPDRINEFKAQSGDIAKGLYLNNHVGSVQMFRTRIPIRKDVPKLQ